MQNNFSKCREWVPRGTSQHKWRWLTTLLLILTLGIGQMWGTDYGPFTITANTSTENPIYGIASDDYVGGNGVQTFTIPKVGSTASKRASSNMTYMGATSGSYQYIKISSGTHFYIRTTAPTYIKSVSIMAARNSTSGQTNGFSYKFKSAESYSTQDMLGYNNASVPSTPVSAVATGNETEFDLYSSSKEWIILSISVTLTASGGSGCTADPAAPTKFEAGSITEEGVTFTITDAANASSYDIYYSTSSTTPEATTAASATSTAKTKAITGLTASTKYYAWVRSVCDDTHKSAWAALEGGSFTTLSGPRDLYKINMTATSETNMPHGQKVELTSTYGTVTGGYADLYNKHASDDSKLKVNSNGITFNGGDPCVILYLNEPLHVGDKIEFTSSGSNQIKIGVVDNKDQTLVTTSSKSYTVASEGLAGKQVIYLWRVSNTTYIKTLTISTTAELPTFRTVTFNPNYTSATNITRTVADGAKVVYVPKDPENGTQEFLGWFEGSAASAFDFSTAITADKTLTAHWSAPVVKHTISFNTDGGTSVESIEVVDGQAATAPTAPKKVGYEFDKWYKGEAVYDWSAAVTGDLTLTAHWNKVYVPQGANYVFENTATLGTAPNAITVTKDNKKNSIAANSRIDNMWLSAMDVYLEDGTYDGGDNDYKGWKIKTESATIKFFVENDCRVIVTTGTLSSGMNIAYTNTSNEAQNATLVAKQANNYDVKGGTLVTLTTQGGNTVTLKGIAVSEIPALSDDATLSDLTLKYGTADAATISGFSSAKQTYYVEVPYGTAKADLPIVGATATDATNALVTINQAKDREDWKTVIRVQAEDRIDDHDKYYEVRFNVLPKLGVELIKVVVPAGTHNDTEATGYFGGTGDTKNEGNSLKIGGGCYAGVVLTTEKTFKAGDVINIHTSAVSTSGGSVIKIYADNSASTLLYNTETIGGDAAGNNFFVLPEAVNNVSSLYVVRTDDNKWNGSIDYIAVYRLMDPFIEEFKIGDAVGTIDGTNIAVEVPYSADLEHLTPAIKYWANGNAQISPAVAEKDFSSAVEYTVSSSYAEDATGAYAPVTYTVTVTKEAHYEAKIGETGYATLVAAVEAAQDGDVIVLQEDVTNGAGVMLTKTDAKEITIDFGGYTYTAVSPAVGSAGTQNQAFHLEKGNTVTLKNGTITSSGSEIKMLIQNYCDLTLENIILDGSGLEGSHRYVLSNNCGDVVIGSGTEITAKTGDVAFDVCATNYYPEGVTVTVKEGATISGIVEYDVWGTKPADNHAELAIEGGNFDVTWNVEAALAEDAKDNLNVSGGTFTAAVPADYCAEGYAPTSWTVGTETKYGVHLAGVIRGAASTNSDGVYYYTLDNDVTIFSSESDGRLKASNHIATSSDIEPCGGDKGGYNVNQSKFVLKFPVNVKEFTLYGANSTERTISKVYVNAEASKDIKISNVGRELTGTYSNTKDGKCQTLTAVYAGENVIAANDYVLVTLSGTANIYRILYTEAECTDPVITAVNNAIGTVGESATVSVEATALGATYQWYTCDENGDNAEIIGTATAASYTFTKGAGVEYFKVVVGNNCNTATVSAVAKAEVWAPTTTLVDVTENTTWDWTLVTSRADGSAIDDSDGNGPKLNTTNGMIIGNYILGNNFDKVEGNNGAYAIRKAANKYYQGASLHMHTTVSGYLKIHARNDGNAMKLKVQNAGRDMEVSALGNWKDYTVYVVAGDVTIYNVPEADNKPMRIDYMEFTVDETPDHTRDIATLNIGNIGTLCVDHNVPTGGMVGATFYQIAGKDEYGKIAFDQVDSLVAGEPYIFQSHTNVLTLYYGNKTATQAAVVKGMHGYLGDVNYTLDIDESNKTDIMYIANNRLWNCEDLVGVGLTVVPNRCYIVYSEVPNLDNNSTPNNGRKRVFIGGASAPQTATGLENLVGGEQAQKLIIDGQMYILRGEKLYDATGRLVK